MNLQQIAQLGRKAAMEKTGQRWVSKLLSKGSKPKSLSLGAPKSKNLLKLRKTFPAVDKQPDWKNTEYVGQFDVGENLATVFDDYGKHSIGSKPYANSKRHEVLHGLLENANAEVAGISDVGTGLDRFSSRLPGGRLEPDGIVRSQRDLIHNALPWMMRPAHRAKRVSNWFQKKMVQADNARHNRRYNLYGLDKPPTMTFDKWNRMAANRSRWSIPHNVMEGVARILNEAGATYGGYKGRPIRGALAAAYSTFGPGGVHYGRWATRNRAGLGRTQTAGSLGLMGATTVAGTSAAYDAIKEQIALKKRRQYIQSQNRGY